MTTIFHLAFPVHDLELAKSFYHHQLGFALGRETQQALILNFGSHQIVAHKVSDCNPPQASIYPRHFGLIFTEEVAFAEFVERVSTNQVPFTVPVKERFKGTRIEHQSFFLTIPVIICWSSNTTPTVPQYSGKQDTVKSARLTKDINFI